MKNIFVYGILTRRHRAEDFGIKDEYYHGEGILYGYRRCSLVEIYESKDSDYVIGDIFEVPDEIEEKLYNFESQFGYKRQITKPIRNGDGKEFKCISYIL